MGARDSGPDSKTLKVARVIATMLALWPPNKDLYGELARVPPPRQRAAAAPCGAPHDFAWAQTQWQCSK